MNVVIIGAGHAGGTAAALLRQFGFEGAITLIGEEPLAPYQRPPLSKAWLKGEADGDSLALKPESFYAEANIILLLGAVATRIDRTAKTVGLSDGRVVSYDTLIIATGARARPLPVPGAELDGVMSLRSAADAERLKAVLGPGKTLAVVGGGYIGLEAAASARALGANAVVIEREARILARVACETLSTFFTDYHRAKGVDVRDSARSSPRSRASDGRVTGVRLADGRVDRRATRSWSASAPSPTTSWRRAAGLETVRRHRGGRGLPAPAIPRSSPSATSPTGRWPATSACSAWRASPMPSSRPARPPASSPAAPCHAARGHLELVGPIRHQISVRRPAVRRRLDRRARRSGRREVRGLPPCRRRHPGRRGGKCAR